MKKRGIKGKDLVIIRPVDLNIMGITNERDQWKILQGYLLCLHERVILICVIAIEDLISLDERYNIASANSLNNGIKSFPALASGQIMKSISSSSVSAILPINSRVRSGSTNDSNFKESVSKHNSRNSLNENSSSDSISTQIFNNDNNRL